MVRHLSLASGMEVALSGADQMSLGAGMNLAAPQSQGTKLIVVFRAWDSAELMVEGGCLQRFIEHLAVNVTPSLSATTLPWEHSCRIWHPPLHVPQKP